MLRACGESSSHLLHRALIFVANRSIVPVQVRCVRGHGRGRGRMRGRGRGGGGWRPVGVVDALVALGVEVKGVLVKELEAAASGLVRVATSTRRA